MSLDDFAKRIDRVAVRVEGNVERAVKDCAGAVARSVISNKPADTGRARSNWTADMDQALAKVLPAHIPGEKGSTADANAEIAINQAIEAIDRFDIDANRSVHISNSLPYIGALNDGHSTQAPAGFVRIAVMEGLATVRGARILKD
ncbi:HK97 gp10 family phage protein [Xanthobacter sp. V0B-10]|uniref:HK97 gp10 family phage protein n=1 Tax=Xanthobacter albus TaxID=3119929 RepID=UPI0037272F91